MRCVAVCGPGIRARHPFNLSFADFALEGVTVTAGVLETPEPDFDPEGVEDAHRVLVRVRAFSCNYRDRAIVLRIATGVPESGFVSVGSEFAGEVVAVGREVSSLRSGDRVMANGEYPGSGVEGAPGGLPTNHASRELQVHHEAKLVRVPDAMSDEEAAAFSLGSQTAHSMIRKLRLEPRERVLVTAPKSNTSLFAIDALRHADVELYAVSTSDAFVDELHRRGVREVVVDAGSDDAGTDPLLQLAAELGGFDAVVDPFFDVYLWRAVRAMADGGRYVTCGLFDQHSGLVGREAGPAAVDVGDLMSAVMVKNLSLIGNCIGRTEDLERGIADFRAGRTTITLDSVHGGRDVGPFFERTWLEPRRFGKVVYRYD